MVVHCCASLRQRLKSVEGISGILVGCGSGDEVVYVRHAFATGRVFGLDVEMRFSPLAHACGCVTRGDALHLPFGPDAFDFAAALHSLEHVGNASQALDELLRVLKPGGWLYVGVPNRTRLLGYMGSFDATFWQKISWNAKDWRARWNGEFRNEAGAHAGFARNELVSLLGSRFSKIELVTEHYLRFKYHRRLPASLLDLLLAPAWIDWTAPAHYALGQKAI